MKKLDNKGEKCVFLDVSKASKAYKLSKPLTKKIVISRGHFLWVEHLKLECLVTYSTHIL